MWYVWGVCVCCVLCDVRVHTCAYCIVCLHEHALPAWFLVCKSVRNVYKPACAKLSMYANCVLEKGCRERHLTADAQVEVSVWEDTHNWRKQAGGTTTGP